MWDLKYRPLKFEDVLGQKGTVQLLKARLANGSALDTNYILAGAHGCGKTTIARILARAMLCQNLNKENCEPCNECDNCKEILNEDSGAYVEQDAASAGTIDNIRDIVANLPFAVYNASKRVYVFDESHRMSRDSQDVLLKPLEAKRMVAIFCTTEVEKIRGTIRSRCEEYVIRRITREDVLQRVRKILELEGTPFEEDAVLTVIDFSGGHARDVLNRLEMISQMGGVTLANVRDYLNLSVVGTYYEILLALREPHKALELVERACERALPEDVSAGLAEAAMNSYRLAHNMYADFVYVDRTLGQKVYEMYGANIVRLAEFFLRSRFITKAGLVCDVLSLAGGLPSVESQAQQPVIQVMPVATETTRAEVSQGAPAAVSMPAPPPMSPPTGNPSPPRNSDRADGVDNLGGKDPAALTCCDKQGVPKNMPRAQARQPQKLNFSKGTSLTELLTPTQWRSEFERVWLSARG
jgi:DNA polymerase III subunit gamma/tau